MKKASGIVSGFSLVEVALALGVASFCLITLLALLPVGIQHYHDADAQSAMVNLSTMIERDLETTPASTSAATTPRFGFSIPQAGATPSAAPQTIYVDASGVASGTAYGAPPNSTSIYRISVFFTAPPTAGMKTATLARIWITFPAEADPTPGLTPTKFSDMFETTVSLNRN